MPLQRRAMALLAVAAASTLLAMPSGEAAVDLQRCAGPHRDQLVATAATAATVR